MGPATRQGPGGDPLSADLAVHRAQRQHELELNRATAAFEHAVLQTLFLLNGGAAVALLTLLGATGLEGGGLDGDGAVRAVVAWSAGVLVAAVATYLGYEAQRAFTMAVSARRLLLEHALADRFDVLTVELLTPRAAQTPKALHDRGTAYQRWYVWCIAGGFGLFGLGVVLAGLSLRAS